MAVDSDPGAVVGAEEGRLSRFQAKKEELPNCVSSRCTSGTQKDGLRGMKPCWKQF